jgi:hypothetical protein
MDIGPPLNLAARRAARLATRRTTRLATTTSTVLLAALLVAACAGPAATVGPGPDDTGAGAPSGPGSERAPLPDAPAPGPFRPGPSPDPTAPDECDAATGAAIGMTVGSQLDAFAADDFDAAYALTSPFFRTMFTRDAFETLIREAYPTLVGNDGHRLDECRSRSRRGFLVAGVRAGAQELVLRYDLSEEADGWRIDGALLLPGVTLPSDQVV